MCLMLDFGGYIHVNVMLIFWGNDFFMANCPVVLTQRPSFLFFAELGFSSSGATGTDQYIAGIQSALAGGFAAALVGLKDL